MSETRTQFDYLLNAFEAASQAERPADHGYAGKRRNLFAYVRGLEASCDGWRFAEPPFPRSAPEGRAMRETLPTPDARVFRCDDASGFALRVMRATDGDFHLSVIPHRPDFDHEHEGEDDLFLGCYSASVRVRMPMIGGGSHDALWHSLARLFTSPTDRQEPQR